MAETTAFVEDGLLCSEQSGHRVDMHSLSVGDLLDLRADGVQGDLVLLEGDSHAGLLLGCGLSYEYDYEL